MSDIPQSNLSEPDVDNVDGDIGNEAYDVTPTASQVMNTNLSAGESMAPTSRQDASEEIPANNFAAPVASNRSIAANPSMFGNSIALQGPNANAYATNVNLSAITWHRESHGLFDYESRNAINASYNLQYACTVLRHETNVMVQPPVSGGSQNVPPEAEPLARLVVRNGKFCVDGTRTIGQTSDGVRKGGKLWRVVKGVPGGHYLQEGDSIKLGRFKLRVRQLVPDSPHSVPQEALCTVTPSAPRLCTSPPPEIADIFPCRICLLEGSPADDPLVRPCECRGTIEYVHLACLRHWIRGRLDLAESSAGSYFYKPLACELCKGQYATHLTQAGDFVQTTPIVELPKTQPPFIVLERDSNRPEFKGVHVISLSEKKMLKLGRGHESDVRFADVSISRWHATVYFDQDKGKGTFVLTDHESKFGTLVAMRAPVPLEQGMTVSFQAGRTVLKFSVQDKDESSRTQESTAQGQLVAQATQEENYLSHLSLEGNSQLPEGPMDMQDMNMDMRNA